MTRIPLPAGGNQTQSLGDRLQMSTAEIGLMSSFYLHLKLKMEGLVQVVPQKGTFVFTLTEKEVPGRLRPAESAASCVICAQPSRAFEGGSGNSRSSPTSPGGVESGTGNTGDP